jgi:hypothetical protein
MTSSCLLKQLAQTLSSMLLASNKVPVAWRFETLVLLNSDLFLQEVFLTSVLPPHNGNRTIHCERRGKSSQQLPWTIYCSDSQTKRNNICFLKCCFFFCLAPKFENTLHVWNHQIHQGMGVFVARQRILLKATSWRKKKVIFEIDARVQKAHKINEPSTHHQ